MKKKLSAIILSTLSFLIFGISIVCANSFWDISPTWRPSQTGQIVPSKSEFIAAAQNMGLYNFVESFDGDIFISLNYFASSNWIQADIDAIEQYFLSSGFSDSEMELLTDPFFHYVGETNFDNAIDWFEDSLARVLLPYLSTGGNDIDNDGDGFTENQGDCNDLNASIYPGATEICGDGIDQDCDGKDLPCSGGLDYNYYLPGFVSGSSSWTGLALSNGDLSNDLTFSVYGNDGSYLTGATKSIPANGQTSFLVAPWITGSGWVYINSYQPLNGLAFVSSDNMMADIPFVNELLTELEIPHIAQNETWDTTVLLCNPQGKAVIATLRYVDQYGVVAGIKTYTLSVRGSISCQLASAFPSAGALVGKVNISASGEIAAFALYSDIKNSVSYYAGINAVKSLKNYGVNLGAFDDDGDGYSIDQGDCNDNDATIHPNAVDVCGDGIDQDCLDGDAPCLGLPDLIVTNLGLSKTQIVYGKTWADLLYTVRNIGNAPVEAGEIQLNFYNNGNLREPYDLRVTISTPMYPGAEVTQGFYVGSTPWPPGSYTVQMEVDCNGVISESDETNNMSDPFSFEVVNPSEPPVDNSNLIGAWSLVSGWQDLGLIVFDDDGTYQFDFGYGCLESGTWKFAGEGRVTHTSLTGTVFCDFFEAGEVATSSFSFDSSGNLIFSFENEYEKSSYSKLQVNVYDIKTAIIPAGKQFDFSRNSVVNSNGDFIYDYHDWDDSASTCGSAPAGLAGAYGVHEGYLYFLKMVVSQSQLPAYFSGICHGLFNSQLSSKFDWRGRSTMFCRTVEGNHAMFFTAVADATSLTIKYIYPYR